MSKEKKITFSEEIDSSISGIALGISFVVMSILVWKFEMFHHVIVDRVVEIVLILLGIVGTMTEVGKLNKGNIKGLDDLVTGIICTGVTIFLIWKMDILWLNVICFLFALIGIFELFTGIFKATYSLLLNRRKSENKKIKIISAITLATELIALVVVVLQLVSEIGGIQI